MVVVLVFGALAGIAAADPAGNPAGQGNLYQSFLAKLAANLGLDQGKVEDALKATKQQMLDEAVQQGRLTQEQAARIAERTGDRSAWPAFWGGLKDRMKHPGGRNLDGAAQVLGMTVDELKAELKSGKKMPQILEEKGISAADFAARMLELKKEALAKAVADGKMTQEQADQILKRMEEGKKFPGPGWDNAK
ncbi:MAG: YckD family protein [Peptococcaceae bacterium]|nr:YckD family protein [Peptococcaceae bacterium]